MNTVFFLILLFFSPAHAGIYSWTPDATRSRELPEQCSPEKLEEISLQTKNSYEFSRELTAYLKQCEKYHSFLGTSNLPAILQMFNIEYDYLTVPNIKQIQLTLRDGTKVSGILALKPDSRPRPIVIAQCGLVCSVDSPSISWPLMHLYDEGPFHVLILGSSTAAEFGLNNKRIYVGGLQEGAYLSEVAEWVKSDNSKISHLISSVHLQGMSLGGHASLFATLYPAAAHVKSVQAHCPVVDLRPSIENIMVDTLPGKFMQQKIWSQLKAMLGKVPIIDKLIPDGKRPSPQRMTEIVAELSIDYNNSFINRPPKSVNEYWQENRFSIKASQLQTPTIIWSAADDPIVLSNENSLRLSEYANKENSNLTLINTPQGSHCAFGLSHGWDIFSMLSRSFVLAHSPEFISNYKRFSTLIRDIQSTDINLSNDQKHFGQKFFLESGETRALITYIIFDSKKSNCTQQDPYLTDDTKDCFSTYEMYVPIKNIGTPNLYTPRNSAEAQMLTRWANSNLRIVDRAGKRLINSAQAPYAITWMDVE